MDYFIDSIINNKIISNDNKNEILRTFYWRFINNQRFRISSKGYSLVFIDRKYVGLYNWQDTMNLTGKTMGNYFTVSIPRAEF